MWISCLNEKVRVPSAFNTEDSESLCEKKEKKKKSDKKTSVRKDIDIFSTQHFSTVLHPS
jgi:hypothetical protein